MPDPGPAVGASDPPARPPAPRTAREMLDRSRVFLASKGIEEARLDAELLVGHALGLKRLGLFLELDRPVDGSEIDRGRELVVRRARGEPVAYLIGVREFYGRDFHVGPGCLVPRPETELLVDVAREWAADGSRETPRVLDVGTGSGCLAVTLALELETTRVVGVDASSAALAWARRNAEALDVEVELVEADARAYLEALPPASLDVVVSNPPYVERGGELPREVRDHEPPEALFAPDGDPDHWVRVLLDLAPGKLAPGGLLAVELGLGQAARALALATERGLAAEVRRDLAGIGRVLVVARA